MQEKEPFDELECIEYNQVEGSVFTLDAAARATIARVCDSARATLSDDPRMHAKSFRVCVDAHELTNMI